MKTILTLAALAMIVVISIASFTFFQQGDYNTSALLVGASFLSISLWITKVIHDKKIALQ